MDSIRHDRPETPPAPPQHDSDFFSGAQEIIVAQPHFVMNAGDEFIRPFENSIGRHSRRVLQKAEYELFHLLQV